MRSTVGRERGEERPDRVPAPAEPELGLDRLAALQRTAGNQAVGRMLQRMSVTSANRVEVDGLKKRYLAANPDDYEGWDQMVRDAVGLPDLRAAVEEAAPEQQAPTIPFGNAAREGRMSEDDATLLAAHYGWEREGATEWNCNDRAHTPKGRVFTDRDGNYWGADNTGHVGFGFKYWRGSPRNLVYMGNVHHHAPFAVIERGTQRTEKKGGKK